MRAAKAYVYKSLHEAARWLQDGRPHVMGGPFGTADILLPWVPAACGLPIHFSMIVLGPSVTLADIETIAEDTVFVIQD